MAPNTKPIHKVLESLHDELEMTIEGDVTAFLGIQFDHLLNGEIQLQQLGLINRVLNTTGMQTCNPDRTPASQQPLGTDKNGLEFSESWTYSFVVMLLYLVANSHLQISYTIHQCTQFTHNPKASHGNAVKCICHYLKGTKNQGMILKPLQILLVDCYVDADFVGQWNAENPQDPLCVKSRTAYVLMIANCPIH